MYNSKCSRHFETQNFHLLHPGRSHAALLIIALVTSMNLVKVCKLCWNCVCFSICKCNLNIKVLVYCMHENNSRVQMVLCMLRLRTQSGMHVAFRRMSSKVLSLSEHESDHSSHIVPTYMPSILPLILTQLRVHLCTPYDDTYTENYQTA